LSEQVRLVALCAIDEVNQDTPRGVTIDGCDYAVFLVDGRLYVTQDHCTHGPGRLSEGFMQGAEVECPFHQGHFDVRTGQPTAAPCTVPLRTWTPIPRGGAVCIDPFERGR
jgi:nitrite reductase/ring-hydroxylating ferredoxin subunit